MSFQPNLPSPSPAEQDIRSGISVLAVIAGLFGALVLIALGATSTLEVKLALVIAVVLAPVVIRARKRQTEAGRQQRAAALSTPPAAETRLG